MPLLGYKVFHLKAPPSSVDTDDAVFVISHTNELFQSKDEYQKRVALYKSPVWTCQCTGQLNLTHEEAWISEKNARESLKEGFPAHYEVPTLEKVHHSTDKLDQIVDKCWQLFHETFVINEPITLKVKANGRQFAGRVVRIDKGSSVPNGDCSSPSSDKENKSSGNSETESPRKWKPKLLPYAYSMKLSTEEKIVNGIPAADIERGTRPPSKELLRLFIRTHAVRYGSLVSSPWVVEDKLVRKYSLKDKCPDLSVHKDRQQEAIERAVEEILRKRKADGKDQKSPPAKKQKLSDKSDKSKKSSEKKKSKKDERKSPHKQSMLNFSAAKSPKKDVNKCDTTKSPRKTPKSPRVVEVSDSSDDENLSLKRTKLLNGECDLAARERTTSSSSDDDVTLADIARQSPAKTPDSKRGRKLTLKTKANVLLNRKGEEVKPKNKKKTKKAEADGKKTKQLTLFGAGGVKKDGTPKSTPRNSPMKQGTPKSPARTPRICTKILKAMNADDKGLVKKLTLQAARELSSKQVKNMPEGDLKSSIEAKVNFIQERQRFKNMTPEQRLAHKKKKIAEMKAKARLQNKQAKMRFEDQDIDGSPLPKPKLVPTPEGLPNECFGDVAMVTEFLACYKDLLMPDVKQCPFSAEEMMQSLSTGKDGFHYLAKVLVVILQTLLQDQIAEDYRELHCPLSDIPVNNYTASEIVRLCLRRHDQDGRPRDADDDRDDEEDDDLPDELIEQLESSEFYELEAKQKLSVLSSLCSRVLGTYSVQDFMEERQKELAKVWKLRINCLKEKNDELKKKKEEKKSANQEPADESSKLNGSEEGTLLDFMKTKSPEKELDLATKVKRRRELAAKSAAEREEREKEQKRLRQLEIDEYKKQVKRQQMEQKFEEVSSRTKIVTRQCPIGTDRNHDRYWVFSNSLPGLFVEKGWVTENISYNVRKANADDDSDMDSEDSAGEEEGAKESEEKKEERKNHALEKSTPHSGQNLWFLYDTKEEIDQLLDRLHKQGVREQQLKTAIEKNMPQLMSALGLGKCLTPGCDSKGNTNGYSKTHLAISACPVANPPEKDDKEKDDEEKEEEEKENKDASEEKKEEKEMETKPSEEKEESSENEMLAGFKRELMDTEMRLRNGGLGGVPEFLLWETRLLSSQTFQTAAQCLLETQQGVQERFLDGIMQRKKVKAAPVSEDVKEEKMDTEEPEAEVPRGVQNWREALETATTWSRIHVLLGILDSCVKWEKSAEHAKCKICRKKKDDYEELILCDECNQPFHLYCLRPALFSVPKGDWFCPACIPTSQKRRSRVPMRYDEGGDDSATDIEGEEKEENCCMCGGDEGLITCSKCPSSYHLDCHDPPLRHEPRGRWECQPCKSGVSRRKRPRAVKQPPPKRRGVVDSESESSESTEEEDNNENAETDDELREAIDESMKSSRQRNRQSATQASTVRSSARPHRPSRRVVDSSTDEDDSPKRKSGRVRTSTGPKPVDPSIFAEITSRLYRHRSSWPFREPVDPEEVPDYYEIITTPITLLDVQERCAEEEYQVVDDYIRDITLLFNNAQEYNRSDSDVYQCMCLLEKYFKETTGKLIPHYTYEREFEVSATRRRSGTTR